MRNFEFNTCLKLLRINDFYVSIRFYDGKNIFYVRKYSNASTYYLGDVFKFGARSRTLSLSLYIYIC